MSEAWKPPEPATPEDTLEQEKIMVAQPIFQSPYLYDVSIGKGSVSKWSLLRELNTLKTIPEIMAFKQRVKTLLDGAAKWEAEEVAGIIERLHPTLKKK